MRRRGTCSNLRRLFQLRCNPWLSLGIGFRSYSPRAIDFFPGKVDKNYPRREPIGGTELATLAKEVIAQPTEGVQRLKKLLGE